MTIFMRFLVVLLPILVCANAVADQAFALNCTPGMRPLGGVNDYPQVLTSECQTKAGDDTSQIRVTSLRINEPLAGHLARGEKIPALDKLFGDASVVKNEVFKELMSLFEKFGFKDVYETLGDRITLNVRAPSDSGELSWKTVEVAFPDDANSKLARTWTITRRFAGGSVPHNIQISDAQSVILKRRDWPAGYQHRYTCDSDAILCTEVWRYLKLQELAQIDRDTTSYIRQMNKELFKASKNGSTTLEETSNWPDNAVAYKKHFEFFRYLGAAGWPERFLVASAAADDCDSSHNFSYHPRPVSVDILLVENPTSQQVVIRDLVGAKETQTGLRLAGSPDGNINAELLKQESLTLAPGAAALIPLRIVFADSVEDWRKPEALETSSRVFQKISAKPRNQFFTTKVGLFTNPKIVRKNVSSFLAPTLPPVEEYVFGPQLTIVGFLIDDDRGSFDKRGSLVSWTKFENLEQLEQNDKNRDPPDPEQVNQELRLTNNREGGWSCPILYWWSDQRKEWVTHGKVIHTADSAAKEMTTTVAIRGIVTTFRLTEEEPEVSFIRRVRLNLSLRGGQRVTLDLPPPQAASATDFRFVIPAYTAVEFAFTLPSTIDPAEIESSEIAVTGFYKRYSALTTVEGAVHLEKR